LLLIPEKRGGIGKSKKDRNALWECSESGLRRNWICGQLFVRGKTQHHKKPIQSFRNHEKLETEIPQRRARDRAAESAVYGVVE